METGNTSDFGDNSTQGNASSQSAINSAKYYYLVYKANLFLVPLPMIGTLFVFVVITAFRQRAKLPVTTTMALAVLLCADFLYMLVTLVDSVLLLRIGESISRKDISKLHVMLSEYLSMIFLNMQSYVQCVVSIERVVAIVSPLRLKTIVTKRRMTIVLVSLAVGNFVLISIISYLRHHFSFLAPCVSMKDGKKVVQPLDECSIRNYNTQEGKIILLFYFTVVRGGLPMIVLLVCSTWIMLSLRKSRRSIGEESRTRNTCTQELRLGIILVVIDAIFIISCAPLFISFGILKVAAIPMKVMVITAVTAEYLQSLGAMTDWLVLLCIGRNIRSVICNCIEKKHASKRPLSISNEMTMQTSDQ